MRLLPSALIVVAIVATPSFGADKEFKRIVRAISDEYGQKPVNLWALSLVKPFVPAARHGMRGMDVAVFEELGDRRSAQGALENKIRRIAGDAWKPFVQVRSRNETSLIYMREDKGNWRLLITSIEPGEATVVHMKLDPSQLRKWLTDPAESASERHRGDDE